MTDVLYAVRFAATGGEAMRRATIVEALVQSIDEKKRAGRRDEGAMNDVDVPPTPVEYYIAALSTLSLVTGEAEDDVLFILSKVAPFVSHAVLRNNSERVLRRVEETISRSDKPSGKRHGLAVLGTLLSAQPHSGWSQPTVIRTLDYLLECVADDNPKVRKAAQSAVLHLVSTPTPELEPALRRMGEAALANLQGGNQRWLPFLAQRAEELGGALLGGSEARFCRKLLSCTLKLSERQGHVGNDAQTAALTLAKLLAGAARETPPSEENKRKGCEEVMRLTMLAANAPGVWCELMMAALEVASFEATLTVRVVDHLLTTFFLSSPTLSGRSQTLPTMARTLGTILERCVRAATTAPEGWERFPLRDLCKSLRALLQPTLQGDWPITVPCICSLFEEMASASLSNVPSPIDVEAAILPILTLALRVHDTLVDPSSGEETGGEDDEGRGGSPWRSAMDRLVVAALAAAGPSAILRPEDDAILKLANPAETPGVSPRRAWVLPLLARALRYAPKGPGRGRVSDLILFRTYVLRLARSCEDAAEDSAGRGAKGSAKMHRARALQLWSLFPAFCAGYSITAGQNDDDDGKLGISLSSLSKVMLGAINDLERPELASYVCVGLSTLIDTNVGISRDGTDSSRKSVEDEFDRDHDRYDDDDDDAEEEEEEDDEQFDDESGNQSVEEEEDEKESSHLEQFTSEERARASDNLVALGKLAPTYLPALFNAFDLSTRAGLTERAASALTLVSRLSQVTTPEIVTGFFRKIMQKYTQTEEKDEVTRRVLLALAGAVVSWVPDLEANDDLSHALELVRPAFHGSSTLRKRAFGMLAEMMGTESHADWVRRCAQPIFELLSSADHRGGAAHHDPASAARLSCIRSLVACAARGAQSERETCAVLLGEVVLSLKEKGSRARKEAFAAFTQLARGMRAAGATAEFIRMVSGGLAVPNPHIRSATVVGVARLISALGAVFVDETSEREPGVRDALEEALGGCLALRDDRSREVARSLISVCKVCAAVLPAEMLAARLSTVAACLVPWGSDPRNRFATKVRIVLEKLARRVGEERVLSALPEGHKLGVALTKRWAERKKKKMAKQPRSDEGDDEAEEEEVSAGGKSKHSRKSRVTAGTTTTRGGRGKAANEMSNNNNNNIRITQSRKMDEVFDESMDLLGSSSLSHIKMGGNVKKRVNNNEEGEKEFKTDERGRIIVPDEVRVGSGRKRGRAEMEGAEAMELVGEEEEEEDDDDEGLRRALASSKDSGEKKRSTKRARKEQTFGREFKAKRAGGDVKVKGMDPYAYIPLDYRMLNRRKRATAVKTFTGIGRGARKRRGKAGE